MKKSLLLLIIGITVGISSARAQSTLPEITVKNINGKIIVSWLNDYEQPITDILIQRSYDSLKNYSTIGTVLNPLNKENGYSDLNPPYNKMYYRLSINFEGGKYLITKPVRPVKEKPVITPEETEALLYRYPWQASPIKDSSIKSGFPVKDSIRTGVPVITQPNIVIKKPEPTYPSQRIFTARDNNVIIHLVDAATKKYRVKFFDENNNFLFELTRLTDEYLIIEKVNFVHSGWFFFEIYEADKLVEKNKCFIAKDGKNGSEAGRKSNR